MTLLHCSLLGQPLLELQEVKKVSDSLNSPAEESFPLYDPEGKLYFIRSLYEGNIGGGRAGQDIWYTYRVGDDWTSPSNSMGKLNNAFNNGVVGIADSGRVLYLNSTYSNKLDYQVGLSKSVFEEGQWTAPRRVRIKRFNPKHDFMSFYVDDLNRVMLLSFAEKDPSNEDLYVSFKEDNVWTRPMNLGPEINSLGADFAPTLSEDGRIVYFTSTARDGPGGADIYMSRRLDDSWLRWSEPVALPEPINSSAYDAYFSLKGTQAFFSSNRDGEFSDLYTAIYEARTQEQRPEGDPLAGGVPYSKFVGFIDQFQEKDEKIVIVMDDSSEVIREMITDDNGAFVMEGLENNKSYFLQVQDALKDQPSVYIEDDLGNRTYLYQDIKSGEYPFEVYQGGIRAIQSATVVDVFHQGPSTFVLTVDSNLLNGAKVELYDSRGKRVEASAVSNSGSFTFENLALNTFYSLKPTVDTLQSSPLSYQMREGTAPLSPLIMNGALFRKQADGTFQLYVDQLLESPETAKFAFDEEQIDASGTEVKIYDENDKLVDESFVNEEGQFAFSNMASTETYRFEFDEELGVGAGTAIYAVGDDGSKVALGAAAVTGGLVAGAVLLGDEDADEEQYADIDMSNVEAVGGDTFTFGGDNAPPPGTMVYLEDQEGNIIDSAEVSDDGTVQFARLPPDANFKLKLANTEDLSMGLDRFFVTDAEGNEIAFNAEGETVTEVIGTAKAESTETFQFDTETGPPPGTVVYIENDQGEIIDSAEVDENGEIRFARLPPDGNFKLKLANTDDLSMGLDRFFVTDAEGNQIGFNAEGETVGEIIGSAKAESTETFQFDPETGPPPGTVVYIENDAGEVIDSAEVDENGEIRFARLPPDGNFKLKLASTEDLSMGLDRFFVTDAEGNEIAFNSEGETVGEIIGAAKAESTETFQFDAGSAPPVGTVVYIENDQGEIIDSAEVDENGEIRFSRLPPDGNFKLKLASTEDLSMGLDRFFITDAEGNSVGFNAEGETVGEIIGSAKAESTEKFTFDPETGPPPGTVVYIENDFGEVIDSAEVDENGEIRFTRLPPDGNFKLKLASTVDGSMGLDRFFVTDAEGNEIGFNDKGESTVAVISKSSSIKKPVMKFTKEPIPTEGSTVYLLDASNFVVDSTVVGSKGMFRTKKLNPTKEYGMRVVSANGSLMTEESFTFQDAGGNERVVESRPTNAAYFGMMSQTRLIDEYDLFAFDPAMKPRDGSKVYLFKDGQRVDSTVTYGGGKFNFPKLDTTQSYDIGLANARFPMRETSMTGFDGNEWKPLRHKGLGFAVEFVEDAEEISTPPLVNVQPEEVVKDEHGDDSGRMMSEELGARPLYDQFVMRSDDVDVRGKRVVLFEEGNAIDTTYIDQDGRFLFDPMDDSKSYELAFEDDLPVASSKLYSVSEKIEDQIEANGQRVKIDPTEIQPPSKDIYRLRISSFDGERPYRGYEPYPLTPPTGEDAEYVDVDDNVTNRSIFDEPDKAVVESDAQPTKAAAASVDYSDFVNKSGVAEIVETGRGWDFRFDFNKFLMSANQIEYINEIVVPMLRENPDMTLVLEGYTDDVGSEEANYRMAVLRVSNVLYHIEMAGIEDTRVKLVPKGEVDPIAPNDTPEGRALNRRVEIIKTE